jgi:hypothetical protein
MDKKQSSDAGKGKTIPVSNGKWENQKNVNVAVADALLFPE